MDIMTLFGYPRGGDIENSLKIYYYLLIFNVQYEFAVSTVVLWICIIGLRCMLSVAEL